MSSSSKHLTNRSSTLGVLLIIFGSLFLVDNFNLMPYDVSYYLFNLKGFLLLIGIVFLSTKENKTPGIVMVSIASFFILSDFLSYEFNFYWYETKKVFWPLLLIVIGLVILSRRKGTQATSYRSGTNESNSDYLNNTNVLGGGDVVINSQNFKGGKVTSIMGGGKYDFSQAALAEGIHEIDLLTMFGGASFIVPSDWTVRVEVTALFGGFSDKRKIHVDASHDPSKELVIKGTVLFGGGELKNYV